LFAEEEYSRIPVYKDNLDNILGFVFVKDLVTLDEAQGESPVVPRLLRPAHVVPEGKRVAELLRELQVKQLQSAIVVDEYGGTAGLVTIEDLVEEIVGEIRDEYDDESEPIVDEGDGRFVLLATVSVGDMVEHLGVTVERDGFETVGGYLLDRLGRVPTVGESVEVDDLSVEVLEAERRRVRKVRVQRREVVGTAPD
ncbi:MAG: transporter associated domain-containing protein, partial [Vicinamibacterales bacterium]|nr:transporter associated domain-containing protein [Vicinamibacterales bacterium]